MCTSQVNARECVQGALRRVGADSVKGVQPRTHQLCTALQRGSAQKYRPERNTRTRTQKHMRGYANQPSTRMRNRVLS